MANGLWSGARRTHAARAEWLLSLVKVAALVAGQIPRSVPVPVNYVLLGSLQVLRGFVRSTLLRRGGASGSLVFFGVSRIFGLATDRQGSSGYQAGD